MRRKKNLLSKLTALCLTFILVLAMGTTAFALDPTTDQGTITINALKTDEGTTVNAYKVINVTFDNDNQQVEEPVYTWVNSFAAWLTSNTNDVYKSYIAENSVVTDEYMNASATELRNLYQAMDEAGLFTNMNFSTTIDANGAATLNVPMGQYVLIATPKAGVTRTYLPVTADVLPTYDADAVDEPWTITNPTVELKGSAPGIEKEATTAGDDLNVKIGDVVDYTVTVDFPNYPSDAVNTIFQIGDDLSNGLTLNSDSVEFYVNEAIAQNKLTAVTYYNPTTDPERSGLDFLYSLDYSKIKEDYTNPDTNFVPKQIIVKYSATVNSDAFKINTLKNTASVDYANDPYTADTFETITDDENVYTYSISLTKKDVAAKEGSGLSGATFKLKSAAAGPALSFILLPDSSGIYRLATSEEVANNSATEDLVVSSNGTLEIRGLDLGTYYLEETVAPDGYVLPEEDITIVLTDIVTQDGILDGNTTTVTAPENSVVTVSETPVIDENNVDFQLYNTKYDGNFNLPKTGGAGTVMFTIIGILLMGGAAAVIIISKKRNQAN